MTDYTRLYDVIRPGARRSAEALVPEAAAAEIRLTLVVTRLGWES